MKTIVITGATGLVATELVRALTGSNAYSIYLVSTRPNILHKRYPTVGNLHILTMDELEERHLETVIDVIIHAGFARSGKGCDYVDSLSYTRRLLSFAQSNKPKVYVNISSQSIYGNAPDPLWKESSRLFPADLYAMAKYATEELTQQALEGTDISWTNVRLCSICEKRRFVGLFVNNAIEGRPIVLTAPKQQCSFIDVRDVATALKALIDHSENMSIKKVYNLGANYQNTIGDIAQRVKRIGETKYHTPEVVINEISFNNENKIGMDASLFCEDFGWSPRYTMDDMIEAMFDAVFSDTASFKQSN